MFASLFTLLWHHRHIMRSLQSAFMKKWKWKRQISQYYYKNIITSGAPWNGCPKLHCLNIYLHITDFFHFLKEMWNLNFCNSQGLVLFLKEIFTEQYYFLDIFTCFHLNLQVALLVKNPPANAEDVRNAGSIPGWGRSPGGGHDNPL